MPLSSTSSALHWENGPACYGLEFYTNNSELLPSQRRHGPLADGRHVSHGNREANTHARKFAYYYTIYPNTLMSLAPPLVPAVFVWLDADSISAGCRGRLTFLRYPNRCLGSHGVPKIRVFLVRHVHKLLSRRLLGTATSGVSN